MPSSRANLDPTPGSGIYLILSLILITLSAAGWWFFTSYPQKNPVRDASTPTITLPPEEPEPTPDESIPSLPPEEPPEATVAPKATKTPVPTREPPTPTPLVRTLNSSDFHFTVDYPSSRTLYDTLEGTGRRYTLYSPQGNIAIHAGEIWSWSHPGRAFTSDQLVSNQPTFIYEAANQTLVDFQKDGFVYTVQCVHGGKDSIKQECQQILSSLKLES